MAKNKIMDYQSKPYWLLDQLKEKYTECSACKLDKNPDQLIMSSKYNVQIQYKRDSKGRRIGPGHYSKQELDVIMNCFEARCPPCYRIRSYLRRFWYHPEIPSESCEGPLCQPTSTKTYIKYFCYKCRNSCQSLWDQINQIKIKMDGCHVCSKKVTKENKFFFDFDHMDPWQKRYNICDMVNRLFPIKDIQAEIQKCKLACISCHKLRTQTQGPLFSSPEFKFYRKRVRNTPPDKPMPNKRQALQDYKLILKIVNKPPPQPKLKTPKNPTTIFDDLPSPPPLLHSS
jgi:hypothetical protein